MFDEICRIEIQTLSVRGIEDVGREQPRHHADGLKSAHLKPVRA